MTREEARKILAMYRPGGHDADDPFFSEAKRVAADDPELAAWFEEEQNFDRAFAARIREASAPVGLERRILAAASNPPQRRFLLRNLGLAAAAILLLAGVFALWQTRAQRDAALDEYRGEMVSIVKVPPSLELEADELSQIQEWLARSGAPAKIAVPPNVAGLQPAGCRVLSFRGHKVTLICFKRDGGRMAHLLVIDRAKLPGLPDMSDAIIEPEGEWMTAAWSDGSHSYLLAAQGDRDLLKRFLERS
jgi:anti-sigma factor RsiW